MIQKLLTIAFTLFVIQIFYAQPSLYDDEITYAPSPAHTQEPNKILEVIYLPKEISGPETDIIRDVMFELQYQTNNIVHVNIISDNDLLIPVKVEKDRIIKPLAIFTVDSRNALINFIEDGMQMPGEARPDLMGYYYEPAIIPIIFIVKDVAATPDWYAATLAHENGHALGLQHSLYKHTMMYPYISSTCMTQRDILQFAAIYHFNPDNMHPCATNDDEPVCLIPDSSNW